jgi:hypothetical protein
MKINPKLLMVALREEEVAQKATKTGFWEHGILGTGQLISWIHGRPSVNCEQVRYRSIGSNRLGVRI